MRCQAAHNWRNIESHGDMRQLPVMGLKEMNMKLELKYGINPHGRRRTLSDGS
jgi:hypothetical protein